MPVVAGVGSVRHQSGTSSRRTDPCVNDQHVHEEQEQEVLTLPDLVYVMILLVMFTMTKVIRNIIPSLVRSRAMKPLAWCTHWPHNNRNNIRNQPQCRTLLSYSLSRPGYDALEASDVKPSRETCVSC